MLTPDSHADVMVIGAGVSGLLAAETLRDRGLRVVVLDKGRGVGGRLATRRTHPDVFDHGAQSFTARDPQFRLRVEAWQAAGIVRPWATGIALADGTFKRDVRDGASHEAGVRRVEHHELLRVKTGAG